MKRALRMFGNRLGNCAYDKVFLRDIKTARPNITTSIRPANYPKPRNANLNDTTAASTNPPVTTNTTVPAKSSIIPPAFPAVYDESVFDNSMMIGEEDLISDENFVSMELEDSGEIYPILPNKRK